MDYRIGAQVQDFSRLTEDGLTFVREVPGVKEIGNTRALQEARADAWTLYRHVWQDDAEERYALAHPEWATTVVLAALKGFRPTLVQWFCERFQNSDDGLAQQIEFMKVAVPRFGKLGMGTAAAGTSSGNPKDMQDWLLWKKAGYCGLLEWGGVFLLDEYWGYCGPEASVWNARRHEMVHDLLGDGHPDFVIGECGRDVIYQDMPPDVQAAIRDGRADYFAGWRKQPVSEEQYAAEVLRYAEHLPPYVRIAFPFGIGMQPQKWGAFALEPVLGRIRPKERPAAIPKPAYGPVVVVQPEEEVRMGSIAVALLPSNQDRNVSPVQPSFNEHGGMHWLSPLIEAACRALGINARTFQAGAESSDTYKLQHLHEQQDAAMLWLKQQPEQWKAAVNFHTDSGDFSHTYAIYGTTREQRSKLLAEAIGPLVQQALGTTSYAAFDKRGDKDYSTYVFYQASGSNVAAVLIELCSHVHANDINTLFARPQQVAEAIARGIANYAGLTAGINWEAKANEYKALADSRGVALDALKARVSAIAKLAAIA